MKRRFRPGLIPTLVFIPLLLVLLRLGVWQLDRAEEKQQVLDHYRAMAELSPLKSLPGRDAERLAIHNRKVELRGHFIADRAFLHDNQVYHGKVGYHVLSPFVDMASGRIVLVNRGWVAMPYMRRDLLPDTSVSTDLVTIRGTIYLPAEAAISFDVQGAVGEAWPKVVQNINPTELSGTLTEDLMPYWLLLDGTDDRFGGYKREWHLVAAPPEQSTSYAIQWFTMAGVLILLYIVLNVKRQN
jgi:surfeit locus 1 family protein